MIETIILIDLSLSLILVAVLHKRFARIAFDLLSR